MPEPRAKGQDRMPATAFLLRLALAVAVGILLAAMISADSYVG